MKKTTVIILLAALIASMFSACAYSTPAATPPVVTASTTASAAPETTGPDASAHSGMPARPGSGATGDPSGSLNDLVEVSGTVKEIKDTSLVLITTAEGGDFMLRFTENTKWEPNVEKTFQAGNRVSARVKLEPTFAPPSQGEVYAVLENTTK